MSGHDHQGHMAADAETHMPHAGEASRHKARMARIKQARDRMSATRTAEKGLVIVNTGNGKGKSTAGFGMIMRCIAHSMPCAVVQFVKGRWQSGERDLIERHFAGLCRIHVIGEGFSWESQDLDADRAAAALGWEKARALIRDPSLRMILLDEINIVLRQGHLDPARVSAFLRDEKPPMTHVVLTGRGAPEQIVEIADLCSEMRVVKHPFRSGVRAQKGIEF